MNSERVINYITLDENFPRELCCEVCTDPMINALMTIPCGHTFCGKCVANFQRNGTTACQMCRRPTESFCRNILAENAVAKLHGKCEGCGVKISLEKAEEHVLQCTDITEQCLCNEKIARKEQLLHRKVCPKQEVTCECGLKMKREEDAAHKKDGCRFLEIDCPLKCGALVKRYLIPSHTFICTKVVQQCPIDGCGQHFRREDKERHMADNQERHLRLFTRHRSRILWEAERAQLRVRPTRSDKKCVFKWKIPQEAKGEVVSPTFQKFERKWRLLYSKGTIKLHYQQGLEQIAIVACFIIQTRDGHQEICREVIPWRIILEEGEHTECQWKNNSGIPEFIILKMEIIEPSIGVKNIDSR